MDSGSMIPQRYIDFIVLLMSFNVNMAIVVIVMAESWMLSGIEETHQTFLYPKSSYIHTIVI